MRFTDVILQTATKVLIFIILAFAVYILLAGHNHPGGGFIAGLITASGFVLLYIAFGQQFVAAGLPLDFKKVGAAGLLISVLTGTGALLFGAPFLQHGVVAVHVPAFGRVDIATAMIFDVGVYLAVVGTTMTIITSIANDG
ncbi:MAG TPA: Na(+)/H(+) antiporter subunit B [Sphingobacteriaceae bacterium]|nr:Na(+)/H(+) antiporter subunit B [Sphingobacteriaceae bacterium]